MSLQERVYSVLVVSAAAQFNNVLPSLLPASGYDPVVTAVSVSAARQLYTEREYDLVILNAPLPDDPGTRFAIDLCRSGETIVLMLVRAELHEQIRDRVQDHGVFLLSKPVSRQTFTLALSWMAAARERLRKTRKKAVSIEEKMEEIRLVNRAKWFLITEHHMEEPEAHRYIEKQAMDRGLTRREVALEVLGEDPD